MRYTVNLLIIPVNHYEGAEESNEKIIKIYHTELHRTVPNSLPSPRAISKNFLLFVVLLSLWTSAAFVNAYCKIKSFQWYQFLHLRIRNEIFVTF
jgi:hypothetical protein